MEPLCSRVESMSCLARKLATLKVICFVLLLAPRDARADVVPAEEDSCKGMHRAGGVGVAEDVAGTCQLSDCAEADRNRRKSELPKNRPLRVVPCQGYVQQPRASRACSIAYPGMVRRGVGPRSIGLAASLLLLVALRRRPLSNKPLQRTQSPQGNWSNINEPLVRRPRR